MFPYTPAVDVDEVKTFMAALGAPKTATVRRGGASSLHPGTPDSLDNVSWITFKTTRYQHYSNVFTWYPNPTGRTAEQWVENLELVLENSELDFEDSKLALEHLPFTVLDRVGNLLTAAGYLREHVAPTVTLYARVGAVWDLTHDNTTDEIFRCARIAALPQLNPEQQLDCAPRDIDVDELSALLEQGMPYLLAQEMFPPLPTI